MFLTPFCPWEGCACRRAHTLPLCGQSHVLGRSCDRGAVQCSLSSSALLARATRWSCRSFSCPSPAACTKASRPGPGASVCLKRLCQDGRSAQPCRSPGSVALACAARRHRCWCALPPPRSEGSALPEGWHCQDLSSGGLRLTFGPLLLACFPHSVSSSPVLDTGPVCCLYCEYCFPASDFFICSRG